MRRSASAALALLAAAVVAGSGAGTRAAGPPGGLATPGAPPSLASDRIYFVLTDRYADGDPANDRGGLSGSREVTGYDPISTAYFHGGDFQGLTGDCLDPVHGLQRIAKLGFDAIWVTPALVNQVTSGGSAGYHGYWGLDFTRVDPHLGGDGAFADFVGCAHRLGMKVILDVVVNHTGDVVQLAGGSTYSDAPYRDCRGKVFLPARYVGKAPFPCLAAGRMPRVPTVFGPLAHAKQPEWLNDPLNYHDRGNIDFGSCSDQCFEQGDFYGLDDLFTEKPNVERGLAAIYSAWIAKYKLDGFRVDTARHVDAGFFKLWVPQITAAAKAAGVQGFRIFGEVPLTDDVELSTYVQKRGLPNVLDFPLQDAITRFASGSAGAAGLRARLEDDDYFRLPDGVPPVPPTFLGNHDMGRAAQQIASKGAGLSGQALLRRTLLGYDLLYLLRGAPVVYYGDEVGMLGTGGDQAARQDMFPTQVADWKTQPRVGSPPIGSGSSFDVADNPIELRLKQLADLREAYPALAAGPSVVRVSTGTVFAVSRFETTAARELLAVFNSGDTATKVRVPTATPSSDWQPLLGGTSLRSDAGGTLAVTVPAASSVLLRADSTLPRTPLAAPRLRIGGDPLTDLWVVSARVGAGPQTVGFAVRRAGGSWQRLAVDDNPPYRAFLDPSRFRRNERVELVATARSLDGRTKIARVVPFRVRHR